MVWVGTAIVTLKDPAVHWALNALFLHLARLHVDPKMRTVGFNHLQDAASRPKDQAFFVHESTLRNLTFGIFLRKSDEHPSSIVHIFPPFQEMRIHIRIS